MIPSLFTTTAYCHSSPFTSPLLLLCFSSSSMGVTRLSIPTTTTTMALPKPSTRPSSKSSIMADGLLFFSGAASAVLIFWAFYSFISSSNPSSSFSLPTFLTSQKPVFNPSSESGLSPTCPDPRHDPSSRTFYDDPNLSYTVGSPLKNWDEKRREWLDHHPSFKPGTGERILLISGSQAAPCENPIADHLLLRLFKNKVDYCRIHGYDFFYNNALFHPKMPSYWNKIPTIRSAMVAHPEVEWIWWIDSDAAFTDMEFKLPLHKYKDHNMVVHGWPRLVFEEKSWTSLNAGIFLIRNCQWSLDFMEKWAAMGPQSPEYEKWGKTQKAEIKDKLYPESDDQTGLVYLLIKEKEKLGKKIYLENEYYFEGYWLDIVGRLENLTAKYVEMERRVPGLRRRHAEAVQEAYGERREEELKGVSGMTTDGGRRPFITHFAGCQPCSGKHNEIYSGEQCWEGMRRALNFADDQVLRAYGFKHAGLSQSADLRPLPYDYPARN